MTGFSMLTADGSVSTFKVDYAASTDWPSRSCRMFIFSEGREVLSPQPREAIDLSEQPAINKPRSKALMSYARSR